MFWLSLMEMEDSRIASKLYSESSGIFNFYSANAICHNGGGKTQDLSKRECKDWSSA